MESSWVKARWYLPPTRHTRHTSHTSQGETSVPAAESARLFELAAQNINTASTHKARGRRLAACGGVHCGPRTTQLSSTLVSSKRVHHSPLLWPPEAGAPHTTLRHAGWWCADRRRSPRSLPRAFAHKSIECFNDSLFRDDGCGMGMA
jgi:hypothetical protein